MGIIDYVLMGIILGGAFYMLYRAFWKKKGHCSGCSSGSCDTKKSG